jgi:hypothetical protein
MGAQNGSGHVRIIERRSRPVAYATAQAARWQRAAAQAPTGTIVTFAQACDEHVRRLEHEKQRKRSSSPRRP